MKLFLVFGLAAVTIASTSGCSNESPSPQEEKRAALFKLAHMNGCMDCHRINATVIGPSWEAIAKRYKNAPVEDTRALLIQRVLDGSKGQYNTWKGGKGMPPMRGRVSEEHIKQLVDYILSLNENGTNT
jgi:cytochrome c